MDKYQSDKSSSISPIYICHLGDLNNYKSETSISTSICPLGDLNKYTYDTSISMYPTGDWNKNKSVINIKSE